MKNDILIRTCEQMGISLTEKQQEQFEKYYEMLVETNKVMNLTAITEYDDVMMKHFADSLSLVKTYQPEGAIKVIDIGTGAGFPGIPLKIAFPEIQITLLDSLNKRIGFLNDVATKLQLENVETLHGRAEDYAKKPEYRETFDICVSRAVANLSTLSEYCIPYVKQGGYFVSYKAGGSEEEITQAKKAVFLLGGKIEDTESFTLPGSDLSRCLVKIAKTQGTPKKYPRKAGLPSKDPL